MRVLVCGGRDFSDSELLYSVLTYAHKNYFEITTIIEGDAKGADRMAGYWAKKNKIKNEKYPADWAKHGRAAGPIRNKQMLDEGRPDLVLAFPGGKGTENMIKQAERAGVAVERVDCTN